LYSTLSELDFLAHYRAGTAIISDLALKKLPDNERRTSGAQRKVTICPKRGTYLDPRGVRLHGCHRMVSRGTDCLRERFGTVHEGCSRFAMADILEVLGEGWYTSRALMTATGATPTVRERVRRRAEIRGGRTFQTQVLIPRNGPKSAGKLLGFEYRGQRSPMCANSKRCVGRSKMKRRQYIASSGPC
jgi:hypothetical protein